MEAEIHINTVTMKAFERNRHGGRYTVVIVTAENGDEVEINNPPAGKGLYVSPNAGYVRARSPHAYDNQNMRK